MFGTPVRGRGPRRYHCDLVVRLLAGATVDYHHAPACPFPPLGPAGWGLCPHAPEHRHGGAQAHRGAVPPAHPLEGLPWSSASYRPRAPRGLPEARRELQDERDLSITDFEVLDVTAVADGMRAIVTTPLQWMRLPSAPGADRHRHLGVRLPEWRRGSWSGCSTGPSRASCRRKKTARRLGAGRGDGRRGFPYGTPYTCPP